MERDHRHGHFGQAKQRPEHVDRARHPAFAAKEPCAIMGSSNGRSGGGEPIAGAQHDYDDIPGTFVFDAERSRQGYGINMFCMSLMREENRKAFKANEAEYLKKFNLTPAQVEA